MSITGKGVVLVEGFKWRLRPGRSEGGRTKRRGTWATPIWFSVTALVNEFVSELFASSPILSLSSTSQAYLEA